MSRYEGSQRTRALFYYFGWQGGTVHQLAAATGSRVSDVLGFDGKSDLRGFSAVRTCDRPWRRDVLAPRHQGDLPFWQGVIEGFWATGPLDGLNDRYPEHAS